MSKSAKRTNLSTISDGLKFPLLCDGASNSVRLVVKQEGRRPTRRDTRDARTD